MKLAINDIEVERPDEPFEVETSDGTLVTFLDAQLLHWTTLTELESIPPQQQVETLVRDPDQFRALKNDPKLDGARLQKLMTAYRKHYGLGEQGE